MGRHTTARARLFRSNLGAGLRQRRLELNLTQEDMAWVVEVTQGTISNYENGRSEVPLSVLIEMCDHLHLQPSELAELFKQPRNAALAAVPEGQLAS